MKKTLIIAVLLAFASMLVTGAVLAAKKSGKTPVKKELKKTAATKSATQTKAKSSSTAQSSSKSPTTKTSKKEEKKPAKQTSSSTVVSPKPIKQIDIYQDFIDPEVGLSGSQTGEQIDWQAITSGGGFSSSINFGLLSAIGQTASGPSSSTNFNLNSGFVQNFDLGCCVTAGNANDDALNKVNIADITFLIARIFAGGAAPPCCAQGNANGDALGKVNIADITFLIARIFAGGPAPICGPENITC